MCDALKALQVDTNINEEVSPRQLRGIMVNTMMVKKIMKNMTVNLKVVRMKLNQK